MTNNQDSRWRHRVRRYLFGTALLLFSTGALAQAGIYKCVDADGGIVFSQLPCAPQPPADRTNEADEVTDATPINCEPLQRFAARAAGLMQAGVSAANIFARYGDVETMSPGASAAINYVYSLRSNDLLSVEDIAAQTEAQCEAHAFGDASCAALPESFTDALGGCDADGGLAPAFEPEEFQQSTIITTVSAPSNKSPTEILLCKQGLRARVDVIFAEMRGGYSSAQGDAYKSELHSLTEAMRQWEK